MHAPQPYHPEQVFGVPTPSGQPPRVLIAPQRYVQGVGVLDRAGELIGLTNVGKVAILASRRAQLGEGMRIERSLTQSGIESTFVTFDGECEVTAIEQHATTLDGQGIEAVVALGGGKCVDAGKAVAYRLRIPVIVIPTLASNDAPCSAVSVLYRPDGIFDSIEAYPDSPALVIVDTGVVAEAPERFLVSGMGDAMATYYEAAVVFNNPKAVSCIGGRPTIAATAIGKACADTLFEHGVAASHSVANSEVTVPLDQVVEANTLLSGLGFESGGLAAAHGIAQSATGIAAVHANYLHGEMVAFGLLTQLAMEQRHNEVAKVAEFFCHVGLPVQLEHLSIEPTSDADLAVITRGAVDYALMANMPFSVDEPLVKAALLTAHDIGQGAVTAHTDDPYQRLHH